MPPALSERLYVVMPIYNRLASIGGVVGWFRSAAERLDLTPSMISKGTFHDA